MRLGFEVSDIASILENIKDYPMKVVSKCKESEWGLRAVIDDPEGHRIELTQKIKQ